MHKRISVFLFHLLLIQHCTYNGRLDIREYQTLNHYVTQESHLYGGICLRSGAKMGYRDGHYYLNGYAHDGSDVRCYTEAR